MRVLTEPCCSRQDCCCCHRRGTLCVKMVSLCYYRHNNTVYNYKIPLLALGMFETCQQGLAWARQSTLWLFIAYHHILAGRDGRSHLSLFPGMPFLNSLASLLVFFFVARIVRLGVTVLRKYAALGSTLRAKSAPVSFTV